MAPTKFTLFTELPPELRIQIWKHAVDNRATPMHRVMLTGTAPPDAIRMQEGNIQGWFDSHRTDGDYPTLKLISIELGWGWPSACLDPDPLWSACRQSRDAIAERCNLESPGGGLLRGQRTDYTMDRVWVNGTHLTVGLNHTEDLFVLFSRASLQDVIWWHRIVQFKPDLSFGEIKSADTFQHDPPLHNVALEVEKPWLSDDIWQQGPPHRPLDLIFLESPSTFVTRVIAAIEQYKLPLQIWLIDPGQRKARNGSTLASPHVFRAGGGVEYVETEFREEAGEDCCVTQQFYRKVRRMTDYGIPPGRDRKGPAFDLSTRVKILTRSVDSITERD
jgi:hypothetical protein